METTTAYPLPNYSVIARSSQGFRATLSVPNDPHYFEGHFPELSVLPGVTLLAWTYELLKKEGFPCDYKQVKNLKFKRVLQENIALEFDAIQLTGKQAIKFSWTTTGNVCASGTLDLSTNLCA